MEKTALQILSENLKALMAESKTLTTQAEVGQAVGVNQTTIGYILRADNAPRISILDGISKAFDVPHWLLVTPGMKSAPRSVSDLTGPEAQLVMLFRQLGDTQKQSEAIAFVNEQITGQTLRSSGGVVQNVTNRRVAQTPYQQEKRGKPFFYEGGISSSFDRELSEAHKRKVQRGSK